MKWPWTHSIEQKKQAKKETDLVRLRLDQVVKEVDRIMDRIETRIEEVTRHDR
jgi:hypothetical protein